MYEGRRILVTGGTGLWGDELVRQLLPLNPAEIIVYSRNESSQAAMSRIFEDIRIRYAVGDIRDREALSNACQNVDIVFHLAAIKQERISEYKPYEALNKNVLGTQNVIEAATLNRVERVINVSTDKAANPYSCYGMTKAIGEKLIAYANLLNTGTKFVCVRTGNVLGTNDGVVDWFMDQIADHHRPILTRRNLNRFFLTLKDAVRLLFKAAELSVGGEIFVMKTPACRIFDLAEALKIGLGKKEGGVETENYPKEKLHGMMLSEFERQTAIEFDEQFFVILPTLDIPELKEKYSAFPPAGLSETSFMSALEIRDVLVREGLL